ncbi:type I-C CRISPR-associated endonuclease Cas1c [Alkalicoccus urumqiensis]|uniref:CRISPR-associated endonuclease Cas1 n=1 Tax=Alkalicoccus urumqiensis TaxID=1548213 RepID=A0A2P6MLG5_ALKUR|nr:type I-C CRISPR-associated endonuclease Cas1c [Alkalicoccus urumqiensis]PRO67119.1 subtype I-C CRISPR-associated endonuclease Cas1 [Alkalicoccus urumqiensis]
MKRLLNTLYVNQPDVYLMLEGETVVLKKEGEKLGKLPLHNLESIVAFGYTGASPALMGYCAERNISIVFMTMTGRFLARVTGKSRGNVVLRKQQYAISEQEEESMKISRNMLTAKIQNSKWVIERTLRDHRLRVDEKALESASEKMTMYAKEIYASANMESMRGIEGQAARDYLHAFDHLILQQKESFFYKRRSRRPPEDNMNALLSFCYTLLANDTAAALEGVGLDAYVGFFHQDRPGRISLALDVMEELRSCFADRFVLSLVNRKMVTSADFKEKENHAVLLTEDGRKKVLKAWQEKKQEQITHPFLKEKISWGLVPHAQSLLLARYIRGDLDAYPPFFWK